MPTVDVGAAKLLVNDVGVAHDSANIPGTGTVEGESRYAMVLAGHGTSLEIRYFLTDSGVGVVDCTSIGDSPPSFERLKHGARIGVYTLDTGERCIKQLRLLEFDPEANWGNPRKTTFAELDSILGSSIEDLLRGKGAVRLGPKGDLLGGRGNDLAVTWPASAGPIVPMLAYTVTRVLPILIHLDVE